MTQVGKTGSRQQRIGAMELFGVGGFALYLGYAFASFFWFFTEFPSQMLEPNRGFIQLVIFVGTLVCYLAVHFAQKLLHQAPNFERLGLVLSLILAAGLPAAVFLSRVGVPIPYPVALAAAFAAGLAGGFFTLRWLDGAGSARVHHHLRFVSLGFIGGSLLFLVLNLITTLAQPLFAFIYLLASFALSLFLERRTPVEKLPLKQRRSFLPHALDVEPSLFIYGIVFGLAFNLLFQGGAQVVFFGLLSAGVGALFVLVVDSIGWTVNITNTQRFLLVVTVAACLVLPFVADAPQTAALCVVIAAWAAFTVINYAMLVRKSIAQKTPAFFAIASGISIPMAGFVVGWAVALVFSLNYLSEAIFTGTMLGLAFLLVLVVMVFFPSAQRHNSPDTPIPEPAPLPLGATDLSESTLLELRCQAVARLYDLSARECDVLAYLVRGRNAAYIQKALVISPHTVKSHIYSIYRKLNIHSQQKLMDYIEDYPVE